MDIIFTFITSTLTGVITYFLGRKKANAELENNLLNNLEKGIHIYKIIIEDLKLQMTTMNEKIEELENKVDSLLTENAELKTMLKNKK